MQAWLIVDRECLFLIIVSDNSTKHKDGSSTTAIWIALSPKVLSEEKQIRDTLAHEMCHVANWVISKQFKNPHGKEFKSWGRKVMRSRPDISVTVSSPSELRADIRQSTTT